MKLNLKIKLIIPVISFTFIMFFQQYNLPAGTKGAGNIRIPLRGNAIDIHFINLCGFPIEVTPEFYNNSIKEIPDINKRSLLFIPNTGSEEKLQAMPIDITIPPAEIISTVNNKKKLVGRKFIQSVIVYNNLKTFGENCWQSNLPLHKKPLKNYGYNTDNNSATYSSFMWTNGTRTRDDGLFSFSNSMNELKKLKYKINIKLKDGRTLNFELYFNAISNLLENEKIITHKPGFLSFSDDTAVLLYTMGGIAAFSAGPWVGAIYLLGDVAWGIAAIGTTIEDDKSYTKFTLKNRNFSWLSSPFDLIINIKNYSIKNKNGQTVDIPEYNILQSRLDYFLGTNFVPENIIIQISASTKGDLHVYIVSGSIFGTQNLNNFLTNNEFN